VGGWYKQHEDSAMKFCEAAFSDFDISEEKYERRENEWDEWDAEFKPER